MLFGGWLVEDGIGGEVVCDWGRDGACCDVCFCSCREDDVDASACVVEVVVSCGCGYSSVKAVQEKEFVDVPLGCEAEEVVIEVAYNCDCCAWMFCEDYVEYCLEAVDGGE